MISGTKKGLGIRIVGGRAVQESDGESYFGIFIKEIIPDSLAHKDGNRTRFQSWYLASTRQHCAFYHRQSSER